MSSSPASAPPFERHRAVASNAVFKSGPLFISSKGIGWKSWKKRWFILTRTSLVFFKNDPNALPERGGEVNLTLGGIDLNNSGSVVVREDKKLLTVLFPDGRDGRAFTLKAETSEDLFEWKTALEHALAQAPNAALVMGHNGIFRNDSADTYEGSMRHWRDKHPIKSLVVGRPILLALEDIDGGPSFLEKALCFLEKHGTKVEGILRQSADVEEVDRRVQEYEQGRTEFAADEDAHVVGDCVKHVLRELPSSPVPASCCTALLEAYRLEQQEARINAMHSAISETFPEPNRRLLQTLKQPGPRDGTIQCFIKRDKSKLTYHLYLCLSSAVLVENGKFLLSAKRNRRTTCTEYIISMDADTISRSSNTYIGKLRSNFLGTKFIIYDTQPPYNGAALCPLGRTSRRFYSKKVSPKVPSGSYNIAQVTYELNVLGTRGPRRMHIIMHSIPASSLEPGGMVPGQPDHLLPRSLEDSFRSMSKSSLMDRSMDFSSSRFSDITGGTQEGDEEDENKERPLVLRNKAPRWHEQLQCWCLNFRGRVTIASVKNFQLIAATQPAAGAPTPSQPAPSEHDKVILQFGKVAKDMFTMDYRYPLSAFQAFALCLSSFDTKLACE